MGNILKAHGIEPAPDRQRQTTWATFIKAHCDVLAAIDFTTIEVWTKSGLITYYLLFVMELSTRRVHFAGCTTNLDETWMKQIARNLTDVEEGFLNGKRTVLIDRDGMIFFSEKSLLRAIAAFLDHYHVERYHQGLGNQIIEPGNEFGQVVGKIECREQLGGLLRYYYREAA